MINALGLLRRARRRARLRRRAARALPVRRLRLEDDHARARARATRRRGCGRPPAGLINSIGLPNRGLDAYLEHDLPALARPAGAADHQRHGLDRRGVRRARRRRSRTAAQVAAIELNVSCPNVATGLDIGADPRGLEALLAPRAPAARAKPLIVKLTPNTADVAACAAGAEAGGADAVSLINTLRARGARARRRGAVARRRQRRPVGAGDPRGRARAGVARRRAASRFRSSAWAASPAAATRASCSTPGRRSSRSAPRASAIRPPERGSRASSRHGFHANCAMIVRSLYRCSENPAKQPNRVK